jgi:endonuclease YncB( thermonuclease family)
MLLVFQVVAKANDEILQFGEKSNLAQIRGLGFWIHDFLC